MKKSLLQVIPLCLALFAPASSLWADATAPADTVRVDFSSVPAEGCEQEGWQYDAASKTVRITGRNTTDDRRNVYLLSGDGREKVEHLLVSTALSSTSDQVLTLVMGTPSPVLSGTEGQVVQIESGTQVEWILREESEPLFENLSEKGGAALLNEGNLTVSGDGGSLLLYSETGAAFYQGSGSCLHKSGNLYTEGSVAMYLEKGDYTMTGTASHQAIGDVGTYSGALLDVSAVPDGSFLAVGMKEQLSTAIIFNTGSELKGSLLQFTSTDAAIKEGVTLELHPVEETTQAQAFSFRLPEGVISFGLNLCPGQYRLLKPGTPEVVEQGVLDTDETKEAVTRFTAVENALVSYVDVQPYSGTTANEPVDVTEEVRCWRVDGRLMVRLNRPEVVEVYQISGQLVRSFQASPGDNAINLPGGMYIVRVAGKGYKIAL